MEREGEGRKREVEKKGEEETRPAKSVLSECLKFNDFCFYYLSLRGGKKGKKRGGKRRVGVRHSQFCLFRPAS